MPYQYAPSMGGSSGHYASSYGSPGDRRGTEQSNATIYESVIYNSSSNDSCVSALPPPELGPGVNFSQVPLGDESLTDTDARTASYSTVTEPSLKCESGPSAYDFVPPISGHAHSAMGALYDIASNSSTSDVYQQHSTIPISSV